jgi:hypothetical protein
VVRPIFIVSLQVHYQAGRGWRSPIAYPSICTPPSQTGAASTWRLESSPTTLPVRHSLHSAQWLLSNADPFRGNKADNLFSDLTYIYRVMLGLPLACVLGDANPRAHHYGVQPVGRPVNVVYWSCLLAFCFGLRPQVCGVFQLMVLISQPHPLKSVHID